MRDIKELKLAASQDSKAKEYWMDKLSGEFVRTCFPGFQPDTGRLPRRMETWTVEWDNDLFSRLMDLSKRNDHTLHVILLTALTVLAGRYTGAADITVGTPIYRQRTGGEFTNTVLPVRTAPGPGLTFKTLLVRVKQTLLEAVENQAFPVELLPEMLQLPVSGDNFPLFDMALVLENIQDKAYIDHIPLNMVFRFSRTAETIAVGVDYNASLYPAPSVGRITRHLEQLLRNALSNLESKVSEIEMIPAEERRELLQTFNNTAVDYPRDKTVHQLIEEQAGRTPDAVALNMSYSSRKAHMTYNELNRESHRFARYLRDNGVVPGTIAAVKTARSVEMIVGITAVLKAGGAYLPIAPDYPEERIQYMLKDSGAKILVTDSTLLEQIETTGPCPPALLRSRHSNPVQPAYVTYTSGSSGTPKGVVIEHRCVVNFFKGITDIVPFSERDVILSLTVISFDIFVLETLLPLTKGSRVVVGSREEQVDSRALAAAVQREAITIFQVTPSRLQLVISSPEAPIILNPLEYLLVGGEAFPGTLLEKTRAQMKGKIYNVYGPTETTVWSTVKEVTGKRALNIGTPIANTGVYILGKTGSLQPVGAAGELCISGYGVARGYLNRPELTRQKFIQNPFVPGDRLYRTGDLARWLPDPAEQGTCNLEFLGRMDHQVKIRGFRIETGEIEHRLTSHNGIKEAVVVVKEDKSGDKRLCAYIVPTASPGPPVTASALIDHLAAKLPAYMIPSCFVRLESIPLNTSGKIDRNALPDPEPATPVEDVYIAPRDETETRLVALWSEVLGIPAEIIGIHAGFFKIGGHSLKANLLVSKIHKVFRVMLSMMDVFEYPTLEDMAAYIGKADKGTFLSIQPAEKREYYPLSSSQGRLYVLYRAKPRDTAYNVTATVVLEGKTGTEKLEEIFRQLISRHESLRTSFRIVGKEPVQEVHRGVEFEIEYYEPAPQERAADYLKRFIRPFDLSKPPLFRAGLIKTGEQEHILIVDMHHIITDGTSQEILLKEFLMLHGGETPAPLRLQYKDYSQWQHSPEFSGGMEKQEAYWLAIFSGPVPVLNIPTDFTRPVNRSFEGSRIDFEISAPETDRLRHLAGKENATPFMLMLAVCYVFLSRLSGREDIVIGTVTAGRGHVDLENIIGVFVNTLALRNYPSGGKSFIDFLGEVRLSTLEAFDNQDYQFEDLVNRVLKERDPRRNPLFDVMFAFDSGGGGPVPTLPAAHVPGPPGTGLKLRPYNSEYTESGFDLLIGGVDRGDRFLFTFQYSTQLFKAETIRRFIDYFKEITAAVAADETVKPLDITLSTDLEDAADSVFRDDESEFGF